MSKRDTKEDVFAEGPDLASWRLDVDNRRLGVVTVDRDLEEGFRVLVWESYDWWTRGDNFYHG